MLPRAARAVRYAITTANDEPGRDPQAWTLQGSADGKDWTVLATMDDPKFRGKGANPFRLAAGSPCLGVGDAELWTAEDRDLIGNPRTVHGAVDLGCYQTRETGLMLMVK